jgi:hypothetical protein
MGYLDDHPLLNIIFHSKSPPRTFWQKLWSFITFRGFICILLLLSSNVLALDIELDNQVKNQKPGFCTWTSLETMGRQRNIKPLIGLLEQRKKDPSDVFLTPNGIRTYKNSDGAGYQAYKKLTSLGLKFYVQYEDNFNTNVLTYANNFGCVIGIKEYTLKWPKPDSQPGPHAILLTKYDKSNIEFFDSNFPNKRFIGSTDWLMNSWTGLAIIIFDKGNE